ncbi:hypothetical protein LWC35_22395 [Pseudonocardia kujensis]|uniref:hypothetical protein n=1 Tax=Pseudonocardia kujensis TaxID=1128675 RepID=UPI001E45A3A2|nr:hypothetical protein [Pseudonocardia kujensis]MCE0765633.1 hypothetical protein [Pseudonocardia kujensis]
MTPVPERDADPVNRSGAFEVVRRGYARDQVDALVRELERRAQAAENARRMAEQHAAGLAEELRTLRAGTPAEGLPTVPQSFGFRAEKVLRLAEREASDIRAAAERDAAEIRAAATREAADLMERAHTAAGRARADADAEWAAVAAERADLAARVAEHAERLEELAGLRTALRTELARLHAALGAELRGLDAAFAVAAAPVDATDEPYPAAPEQGPTGAASGGEREPVEEPVASGADAAEEPAGRAEDGVVEEAGSADRAEDPAEDPAERTVEATVEAVGAQAGPVAEETTDRAGHPDHPEPAGTPAAGDQRGEAAAAVWTPTPGTADLFEAEQTRPADRGAVRVPEQRREQNTENRHALRPG